MVASGRRASEWVGLGIKASNLIPASFGLSSSIYSESLSAKYAGSFSSPTGPFAFLEPQDQDIGEFYLVRERRSPTGPFKHFRASGSGDQRIVVLYTSGWSCDGFLSFKVVKGPVGSGYFGTILSGNMTKE